MGFLCCITINWNAVAALGTLVALGFTFYFSWENRRMLIDSRRARLIFQIKNIDGQVALEVKNVGYSTATKVSFKFDKKNMTLLNSLPLSKIMENIMTHPFTLNGTDTRLIWLLPLEGTWNGIDKQQMEKIKESFLISDIQLKGNYIDTYTNKSITINEYFNVRDFMTKGAWWPEPHYNIVTRLDKILTKLNK